MFIIIKYHVGDVLHSNQTIFPRPTPWVVAWHAFWEYLNRRDTYRFTYIPAKYAHLLRYDIFVEDEEILLREDGRDLIHVPVLPMTLLTWIFYVIESWASGLLFMVWNHRLFAGSTKLTRSELLDKLARVEKELERLRRDTA
jgi:hypothetical protein